MTHEPVTIPEKLFFKIGEVCELVDVQAHVLRYWESEFPTLSPQKNKSGQRSYRRRDVEIALRIKQLLYNEMFTIAGAKKKLQFEAREGNKPKPVATEPNPPVVKIPLSNTNTAPMLFDTHLEPPLFPHDIEPSNRSDFSGDQRDAIKVLASHLLELREMLKLPPGTHA